VLKRRNARWKGSNGYLDQSLDLFSPLRKLEPDVPDLCSPPFSLSLSLLSFAIIIFRIRVRDSAKIDNAAPHDEISRARARMGLFFIHNAK